METDSSYRGGKKAHSVLGLYSRPVQPQQNQQYAKNLEQIARTQKIYVESTPHLPLAGNRNNSIYNKLHKESGDFRGHKPASYIMNMYK